MQTVKVVYVLVFLGMIAGFALLFDQLFFPEPEICSWEVKFPPHVQDRVLELKKKIKPEE